MKRKAWICGICFLIAALLATSSASASALSRDAFSEKYNETAAHLQTMPLQVGSVGGDWMVLGLARGGLLSDADKAAYVQNAESYVKSVGSAKLHARKSTDNSRVILALASVGINAENVAGYDLLSPLADFDYVSKQGINGVVWALTALDCCDYPVPQDDAVSNPVTREKLLRAILDRQCADGGWSLDGDVSDPDMTGMAVQALAPYRFYDGEIQAAIDRALLRLEGLQDKEGGYASYDDFNPESCAQVAVALASLGIDPQQDERFSKGGKSLLDSMMRFSVPDGFAHTIGFGYNQMATEQVFYAMTACQRLQKGQSSLYDMRDVASYAVIDVDGDGATTINDATMMQRFLAEFSVTLSAPRQRFADIDRDGQLSITDVTLLQKLLAQ